MVKCNACLQPMMTMDETRELEETEISYCCKHCKKAVHSHVMCNLVWMPADGHYFCCKRCVQINDTRVLDIAREEAEDADFGPDHEAFEDWLEDHRDEWLPLCQRPDSALNIPG